MVMPSLLKQPFGFLCPIRWNNHYIKWKWFWRVISDCLICHHWNNSVIVTKTLYVFCHALLLFVVCFHCLSCLVSWLSCLVIFHNALPFFVLSWCCLSCLFVFCHAFLFFIVPICFPSFVVDCQFLVPLHCFCNCLWCKICCLSCPLCLVNVSLCLVIFLQYLVIFH